MQTEISDYVKAVSYKQALQKPNTDGQRNIIKNIISSYPEGITDLEICLLTGISRSSVTARRNEIKNVFAVGIAKIHDKNRGRLNVLWGMNNGL